MARDNDERDRGAAHGHEWSDAADYYGEFPGGARGGYYGQGSGEFSRPRVDRRGGRDRRRGPVARPARVRTLGDLPAAEYYTGRTGSFGGGNYGGSQYYQGGGFGDSGLPVTHSDYTDVASAIGVTGYGGYGGSGMGGLSGYGESSAYGGSGMPMGAEMEGTHGQRGRPTHAGRGPKNWKRTDERVMDDLAERLERHPQIDASDVEVHVKDGEVTLTGTVSDRLSKRLTEDVAWSVIGVSDVQNQLRVTRTVPRVEA